MMVPMRVDFGDGNIVTAKGIDFKLFCDKSFFRYLLKL